MFGFAAIERDVAVSADAPAAIWELKLLSLDQIRAEARPSEAPATAAPPAARKEEAQPATASTDEELSQRAADGLLINGSMNNGAASPFAQAAAFGNSRFGGRSLYNGGIGISLDNSALDARAFSLTGQNTPKPAYNRMTGMVTLGGPLQIPHLFGNGGNFFAGYQWTRNSNATTASALMPDAGASATASSPARSSIPSPGFRFPATRSRRAGSAHRRGRC